ncbi:thiol-disulfide isomerase/thioredoxin [Novosphingobium sp. PhB165]|uniref:redoxin domain-containing protein n=1 Tax=Novosphingobium sp. PhB165 TaxID=2485105 RepID=UPI00104AF202|nr:redoxin domain-containing protein [Novosphingobium sp. PhB165]TCM15757.1 thiol-disulfide isomerase/thioredoxin [Novosphingobium sp. PhB165]
MTTNRSIGFIAAALMAAGTTTATCWREALARSPADGDAIASAPSDATPRPLQVLADARPWLGGAAPSLRGKVVVVNFWTYSCINSLRALPYLRGWNERYGDKGLTVIGVHAPEFDFEHDPGKVRAATQALGVGYPNVQDNDYAVWRAFGNEGWPGFYIIDAHGRVRGYTVGEGNYAEAERLIRKLLAEAGNDVSGLPEAPIGAAGVEAQADWPNLQSPEAYLGYAKAQAFASPGGLLRGGSGTYTPASSLPLNRWDLAGSWTVAREFARLDKSGGAIRFHFHARDAHAVLGAPADGQPVRFRVTIDGKAPGADHGTDTDPAGWGELRQDRLYQLVRQHGPVSDRTVRIEFSRPGVRAYSFTFG